MFYSKYLLTAMCGKEKSVANVLNQEPTDVVSTLQCCCFTDSPWELALHG